MSLKKFFSFPFTFLFFVVLTCAFLINSGSLSAQDVPAFPAFSSELVSDGAYCWFADPRAIHFTSRDGKIDRTFIGWINRRGDVMACQYDYTSKKIREVVIHSAFERDDHDNPTFLVLPDEHIIIFYTRHTNEPKIWYRVSKNPGDITDLLPPKSLPTDHNTTYPTPFLLSGDPSHIYLTWRGIKWHPTIATLTMPSVQNGYTAEFALKPTQIVHSSAQNTGTAGSSCRPYAKYISDGKSRIYLAFTATHPDNINPTMLYGAYVDVSDLSLRDLNGKVLDADLTKAPIMTVTNTETIADSLAYVIADDRSIRHWIWDSALGKDGAYYVLFTKISPDKTVHTYYYGKWVNGKWHILKLADAGGWFHQNPNTEKCYSAGMAFDHENPQNVYVSVPVGGVFEIVRMTVSADASEIVETTSITRNSTRNHIRPYVISGGKSGSPELIWMHGDYYFWSVNNPNQQRDGFYTGIFTNFISSTK